MKRFLFIGLVLFVQVLFATPPIPPVTANIHDKASLQRGAKIFMNYCAGCHSLSYLDYKRMALDIGIVKKNGEVDALLLKQNLIFSGVDARAPIKTALPPDDAKIWFGVVPPDLSLYARIKGASWLSAYLTSFYQDSSRPFGSNNLMSPNVAMPNILESLFGEYRLVQKNEIGSLLLIQPGTLSQKQHYELLSDLVNFLVYVGEPAQSMRKEWGLFVLLFLTLLFVLFWALKRIYWKRIPVKTQK